MYVLVWNSYKTLVNTNKDGCVLWKLLLNFEWNASQAFVVIQVYILKNTFVHGLKKKCSLLTKHLWTIKINVFPDIILLI